MPILVSELTQRTLLEANREARESIEALFAQPPMEGVVKGQERSGWFGIIHVGILPDPEGPAKRCIIHTSLEGDGRRDRNVEADKIYGYFMAKSVMRSVFDDTRTIYTPAIRGQKIVHEDPGKNIRVRQIYVNYEPRHLAFTTEGIDAPEYASLLGRDIVRFMTIGMTNAPRHIRPNYLRDSVRKTCMIDIDRFDPRTFHWNAFDAHPRGSLNREALMEHENVFFRDTQQYFLNGHLPKILENREQTLRRLAESYWEGASRELVKIKGPRIGKSLSDRFRVSLQEG